MIVIEDIFCSWCFYTAQQTELKACPNCSRQRLCWKCLDAKVHSCSESMVEKAEETPEIVTKASSKAKVSKAKVSKAKVSKAKVSKAKVSKAKS